MTEAGDRESPLADALRGDNQILADVIPPADRNGGIEMSCVVMIDGHPFGLGTQSLLDTRHKAACQVLQIVV